jgi:hypothetical protein
MRRHLSSTRGNGSGQRAYEGATWVREKVVSNLRRADTSTPRVFPRNLLRWARPPQVLSRRRALRFLRLTERNFGPKRVRIVGGRLALCRIKLTLPRPAFAWCPNNDVPFVRASLERVPTVRRFGSNEQLSSVARRLACRYLRRPEASNSLGNSCQKTAQRLEMSQTQLSISLRLGECPLMDSNHQPSD